ncbi:unnamed protein product [Phytomonas sp. EM1]|nr:unnamed protein product [Phytomonas sp. EM1]|eukprot:CCW60624.1 unnamed protein product [Phytomonas sp. isolate EM1]
MINPLLAWDYVVPKKSAFCLEDMDVVTCREAAPCISSSVVDSVLYSTNGNIGLHQHSNNEVVYAETAVILNGAGNTIEPENFIPSSTPASHLHTGSRICTIFLDCIVDGEFATLSSVPSCRLSLRDGTYRSLSCDVINADGSLVFDSEFTRVVDSSDLSAWSAQICYNNFRINTPTSLMSDFEDYHSAQTFKGGDGSMDCLDSRDHSGGPASVSKSYKVEFVAILMVELDEWEVIGLEQIDELWQRSLISNQVIATTTNVQCVVTDSDMVSHHIPSQIKVTVDDDCDDSMASLSINRHDMSFVKDTDPRPFPPSTPVFCESMPINGTHSHLASLPTFGLFNRGKRRFVVEKYFSYLLPRDSLPTSVTITFQARHSVNVKGNISHSFAPISDMVRINKLLLDELWSTCQLNLDLEEELVPNRTKLGLLYAAFRLHNISQTISNGLGLSGWSCTINDMDSDLTQYIYYGIYYTLVDPCSAFILLKFFYRLLPQARRNASGTLFLSHGALYPSKTMNGGISKSFFGISSPKRYVNSEIGYLIHLYFLAMGKIMDSELVMLLELMLETARVWPQLGKWSYGRTVFRVDNFFGIDTYNDSSPGNFYVNLSVQQHLRLAVQLYKESEELLGENVVKALLEKLNLTQEDLKEMEEASEAIKIKTDQSGVYMVHDYFDTLAPWKGECKHPLHLNYHPLSIYRRKVVNVPDVLLGMFMYHEQFETYQFERNLAYYSPLCTFDTPESLALVAITQCRARGNLARPIPLLRSLLHLDLDNIIFSNQDGLHFGAMAAALLSLIFGIGGVSVTAQGLRLNPILPACTRGYSFIVHWRGAILKTSLNAEVLTYELLAGDSVRFIHSPTKNRIHLHTGFRRCQAMVRLTIPRISHNPTGGLEGAVFLPECLFENFYQLSYLAWYRILERFFENYRTLHHRDIPPLSPSEFIEKVLYQSEEKEITYIGINNVLLDRGIVLDLGAPSDAEIVETVFGLANAKVAEMSELLEKSSPPLNSNLIRLIQGLAQNGLPTCVATYSRSLRRLMQQQLELSNCFVAYVDGEEAQDQGIKGRPHLDLFYFAAKKIHVDPSRCIVFASHLDRGYNAEEMAKFRMFLDVDDPFGSSRVPLQPYPTLSEAYTAKYQRQNPVVRRLTLKNIPKTIDELEDFIDGGVMEDSFEAQQPEMSK